MQDILTISINSPEKLIWEGKAYAVSSENSQGPFDILPRHANFITIIENKPITVRTGSKDYIYKFHSCLIYSHDNYVYLYTL